jgi:hypothetical protein
MKTYLIFTLGFLLSMDLLASATIERNDHQSFEKRLKAQRQIEKNNFYRDLSEFKNKLERYEQFCKDKNEKQFLKKLKQIIQENTI